MECKYNGLAKLSKIFLSYWWTADMIVGLGKARKIKHFEDIACKTSLLTHSHC